MNEGRGYPQSRGGRRVVDPNILGDRGLDPHQYGSRLEPQGTRRMGPRQLRMADHFSRVQQPPPQQYPDDWSPVVLNAGFTFRLTEPQAKVRNHVQVDPACAVPQTGSSSLTKEINRFLQKSERPLDRVQKNRTANGVQPHGSPRPVHRSRIPLGTQHNPKSRDSLPHHGPQIPRSNGPRQICHSNGPPASLAERNRQLLAKVLSRKPTKGGPVDKGKPSIGDVTPRDNLSSSSISSFSDLEDMDSDSGPQLQNGSSRRSLVSNDTSADVSKLDELSSESDEESDDEALKSESVHSKRSRLSDATSGVIRKPCYIAKRNACLNASLQPEMGNIQHSVAVDSLSDSPMVQLSTKKYLVTKPTSISRENSNYSTTSSICSMNDSNSVTTESSSINGNVLNGDFKKQRNVTNLSLKSTNIKTVNNGEPGSNGYKNGYLPNENSLNKSVLKESLNNSSVNGTDISQKSKNQNGCNGLQASKINQSVKADDNLKDKVYESETIESQDNNLRLKEEITENKILNAENTSIATTEALSDVHNNEKSHNDISKNEIALNGTDGKNTLEDNKLTEKEEKPKKLKKIKKKRKVSDCEKSLLDDQSESISSSNCSSRRSSAVPPGQKGSSQRLGPRKSISGNIAALTNKFESDSSPLSSDNNQQVTKKNIGKITPLAEKFNVNSAEVNENLKTKSENRGRKSSKSNIGGIDINKFGGPGKPSLCVNLKQMKTEPPDKFNEETLSSTRDSIVPNVEPQSSTGDTIVPNEEPQSSTRDNIVPNEEPQSSTRDSIVPNEEPQSSTEDTMVPNEESTNSIPPQIESKLQNSQKENAIEAQETREEKPKVDSLEITSIRNEIENPLRSHNYQNITEDGVNEIISLVNNLAIKEEDIKDVSDINDIIYPESMDFASNLPSEMVDEVLKEVDSSIDIYNIDLSQNNVLSEPCDDSVSKEFCLSSKLCDKNSLHDFAANSNELCKESELIEKCSNDFSQDSNDLCHNKEKFSVLENISTSNNSIIDNSARNVVLKSVDMSTNALEVFNDNNIKIEDIDQSSITPEKVTHYKEKARNLSPINILPDLHEHSIIDDVNYIANDGEPKSHSSQINDDNLKESIKENNGLLHSFVSSTSHARKQSDNNDGGDILQHEENVVSPEFSLPQNLSSHGIDGAPLPLHIDTTCTLSSTSTSQSKDSLSPKRLEELKLNAYASAIPSPPPLPAIPVQPQTILQKVSGLIQSYVFREPKPKISRKNSFDSSPVFKFPSFLTKSGDSNSEETSEHSHNLGDNDILRSRSTSSMVSNVSSPISTTSLYPDYPTNSTNNLVRPTQMGASINPCVAQILQKHQSVRAKVRRRTREMSLPAEVLNISEILRDADDRLSKAIYKPFEIEPKSPDTEDKQEEIFVDAVDPSQLDILMPLPDEGELCFTESVRSRSSTPFTDRTERSPTPRPIFEQTESMLAETDRILRQSRSNHSLRRSFTRSLSGMNLNRVGDSASSLLAEATSELSAEQGTSHLAGERIEAEQAERMRLEKEVSQLQGDVKRMTNTNDKLELEKLALRSEILSSMEFNGDRDDDGVTDASLYKRKYDWAVKEMDVLRKQLKQQQEDDLDQLHLMKKQLEKKVADAYEEAEEQRQIVGQMKKKTQRLQAEMNDLKILLEEQTSRNNLLEKKQRKFDQELQSVVEDQRNEKMAKEKVMRERDQILSEKYSFEQEVSTLKLELELKEDKLSSVSRELNDLQFTGKGEEEVALLKKARHDLEMRVKDQEEELDDLAGQVQMLEGARVRLEMSIEQMRKENRKETSQREEEIEEIRVGAQKKIKSLEAQLENEHDERTQLVREKHDLERRLSEAQSRSFSSVDEESFHKVKKELKKTKALLRDTQTMLEKSQTEGTNKLLLRQLKTQLEDAEFAKAAAVKARQSAETDYGDIQSQLDENLRAKKDLEDKLFRATKEKSELHTQLEESEEEVSELMKKYKSSVNQISVDQVNISEQAQLITELEHDKQSLQDKLNELSSKVEALEGETANIHTQRRLQIKIKELESKLDLELTTRQRLESQISRFKDQLDRMNAEFDSVKSKEIKATEHSKKLNRQLREAKDDVSNLQQKLTDSVSKKQEVEKRNELSESEIMTLKSDLKLAFKRIEDLQMALQGDMSDSDCEISDSDSGSEASLTTFLNASNARSRLSSSPNGHTNNPATTASDQSRCEGLTPAMSIGNDVMAVIREDEEESCDSEAMHFRESSA